jgi:arylsulfatase A-like enzyme
VNTAGSTNRRSTRRAFGFPWWCGSIRRCRSQKFRFALNIDVAPTVAEIAGIPIPAHDGQSFAPLLEGRRPPWRGPFLIEHLRDLSRPNVPTFCAVRTGTHVYAVYRTGEEELYDQTNDRFQLRSIRDGPVLEELRIQLKRLCTRPPPGFTFPF